LLQSLLDFTSPQIVKPEAVAKNTASPAAQALVGKKAGGKTGEVPGRFARSLEKARGSVEPEPGQTRVQAKKTTGKDLRKKIEELLAGAGLEAFSGLLSKLSPKDLANLAEVLGLKDVEPEILFPSDSAPSAGDPDTGKLGQGKRKLADLLGGLAGSAGVQRVLNAIIAGKGLNKTRVKAAGEAKLGKITGQERKQAKVVVLDLRKERAEAESLREGSAGEKAAAARGDGKAGSADGLEKNFSLLLRGNYGQRAPAPAAETAQSIRSQGLPQRFQERFVPEVVKQTGIILKNGGAGEIRLVLKPENLGSVRIRLSLSESSLEGRIVVDNSSVKELVESSLDSLRNALRQEGFQTASLEVSVGHRRSGDGAAQNQGEIETPLSSWWSSGSEEFDKAVPLYLDIKPDYELINLFV